MEITSEPVIHRAEPTWPYRIEAAKPTPTGRAAGGYLWIPDEASDPNPCPPNVTEMTTWNSIKSNCR